jgi:hypothetical protein
MRNIGLIAFGVTTCVLVPAAISRLSAGPQQVGKLVAPGAESIELDGATIDVTIDRAVVDPGGDIHVKLVGKSAKAKRVALGVLVYGSSGSEGSRVPDPPVDVAHEEVTLALDGKTDTTKDVKVRLAGAVGGTQPFAHYTILVMPRKAADRLAALRDRFRVIPGTKNDPIPSYNNSGSKFTSLYWQIKSGEAPEEAPALFEPGGIARLEAHTRIKGSAVSITTPPTTRVGEAYTVAVTIKNPTKRKKLELDVTLATPAGLVEQGYTGLRDEAVVIEPASIRIELGRHETKRVEFKVTPKVTGTLGLYAHATTEDWVAELEAGAVEATDVIEAAPIVGIR